MNDNVRPKVMWEMTCWYLTHQLEYTAPPHNCPITFTTYGSLNTNNMVWMTNLHTAEENYLKRVCVTLQIT